MDHTKGDQFMYDKITTEDVIFTRADDHVRELTWKLNGEVFASPLELASYVEGEKYLSQQELTKDGRCTYFVLAHKHDGTHIVASCEAVQKTVFIAGKHTGVNGGVLEATGYAIASVYTNPKYRRLGMAACMLEALQLQIDQESDCSALYSDVGKNYYVQSGWDVFPSEQATVTLHADEPIQMGAGSQTRYLRLDELPALCKKDVAQMKAKFQHLAADHTKTHIAFAPTYAQIAWQMAREDFIARAVHAKLISHRGAITHHGRSWVYWEHDWKAKQLKILRFVLLDVDPQGSGAEVSEDTKAWGLVELLQAAAAEAAAWELKTVLIWNPDATTTRGIKGFHNLHEAEVDVMFDERKNAAIPSFRWKGGRGTDDTVWEDNHCYAWC